MMADDDYEYEYDNYPEETQAPKPNLNAPTQQKQYEAGGAKPPGPPADTKYYEYDYDYNDDSNYQPEVPDRGYSKAPHPQVAAPPPVVKPQPPVAAVPPVAPAYPVTAPSPAFSPQRGGESEPPPARKKTKVKVRTRVRVKKSKPQHSPGPPVGLRTDVYSDSAPPSPVKASDLARPNQPAGSAKQSPAMQDSSKPAPVDFYADALQSTRVPPGSEPPVITGGRDMFGGEKKMILIHKNPNANIDDKMVIAEARKKLDEKVHGGYNMAFDGNTLRDSGVRKSVVEPLYTRTQVSNERSSSRGYSLPSDAPRPPVHDSGVRKSIVEPSPNAGLWSNPATRGNSLKSDPQRPSADHVRQMLLAKSMAADGTQHSDIPLPPLRRGGSAPGKEVEVHPSNEFGGALSVQANRDENYEYQYEGYMDVYDLNTTYQTQPKPKPAAQAPPPVAQANKDENYEYQYEGYMDAYDVNTTYQPQPKPKLAAPAPPPAIPNHGKEYEDYDDFAEDYPEKEDYPPQSDYAPQSDYQPQSDYPAYEEQEDYPTEYKEPTGQRPASGSAGPAPNAPANADDDYEYDYEDEDEYED